MTMTSTVPSAVTVLQGYMTTVASANPALDPGVYLGAPVGNVANNFMMVGHLDDGAVHTPITYDWSAIPGAAHRVAEEYALHGTIRAWAGDIDPAGRLADAYAMRDGLHAQIVSDIGGSGNLTSSGSWGAFHVEMVANGPLASIDGWGVVLAFELYVINAELSG